MLKLSRYAISKTHGFCPDVEPISSHKPLEPHTNLLKALPIFNPSSIESLPEFTPFSNLTSSQLEFSFLVHLMLNSALYWHSDSPITEIPSNLAVPTIKLSKLLQRPPILNLASIQYHNWQLIDKSQDFHPSNLRCIFSFSGTRDESNFYNYANYIEFLAAPAVRSIVNLPRYYDQPKDLKNQLQIIRESIREMTHGLELLSENLNPELFYFGFRKKLRSFSCGVSFQGTGITYDNLSGASAVQSPLLKLIDSFLGNINESELLKSSEDFMKIEHRDIINEVRKRDVNQLKELILRSNCADIWNSIIIELHEFREAHIRLSHKFVIKPSKMSDNIGTGGSPLRQFLQRIADKTMSQKILFNSRI